MTKSLRARLFVGLTAVILLAGCIGGAFTYLWAFDEAIEMQDSTLIQIGSLLQNGSVKSDQSLRGVDADAEVDVTELGATPHGPAEERRLWSLQDEVSEHKRRYVARTLRETVTGAGLEVERQTYVSTLLLPVIYLGRQWLKVRRIFQKFDTENDLHPQWSNGILRSIFEFEIPILRRIDMPFGASILCVARKAS